MARAVGMGSDQFLITEHEDKSLVPEERQPVSDDDLWAEFFQFELWYEGGKAPAVDVPLPGQEPAIAALRNRYHELAESKRLVVKNPANLVRLDVVDAIFPDALYIFCIRHPWDVIQSISIKGILRGKVWHSFLLKTAENFTLPMDMLLRAAHTWAYAVGRFEACSNERWLLVRYEDFVSRPETELSRIYRFAGIDDVEAMQRAAMLPRVSATDYAPLLDAWRRSQYQPEILSLLEPLAERFGYDLSMDQFSGNTTRLMANKLSVATRRLRRRLHRRLGVRS